MIVTFYSYKGGTGRTMALANIAVLLAQAGHRVLAVDFDLEAPGLWRFFQDLEPGLDRRSGLIDMLAAQSRMDGDPAADWHRHVTAVNFAASTLSLLTSGRLDASYPARVLNFNWREFFRSHDGGAFIENLRTEWAAEYDFTLIDSRTGITDTGGVCTIALPDLIVPVFVANHQNVDGVLDVLSRAQEGRQSLAYDRPPALILPILSRFDTRTEYESANEWLDMLSERLTHFYADWLPRTVAPRQILERTKLPHVAYFSFGEKLAVLQQGTSDPESLGYALNTVSRLIGSNLTDATAIALGVTPLAPAGSTPAIMGGVPTPNPDFTGREETLRAVCSALDRDSGHPATPHALQGLSGVGKTQLAVEYIRKFQSSYGLIWWIQCDDNFSLRRSFVSLAKRLGLAESDDIAHTVTTVLDQLRRGVPTANWLLVYDAASEPDQLRDYLPSGPGHVLITSRSQSWAAETRVTVTEVDVFTAAESVQFLRRRWIDLSAADADRLAEELGHLPLALEQAAALHRETGMPVTEYLRLLQATPQRMLAEGEKGERSVAGAWRLAFDQVRQQSPAAAQLLELCAFLGSDGVAVPVLIRGRGAPLPEPLADTLRDDIKLRRAIRELGRYALAQVDTRRDLIKIHRLVRVLAIDGMSQPGRAEMKHSAHALLALANPGTPDNEVTWPEHAQVARLVLTSGVIQSADPHVRRVALDQIRYYYVIGDYAESAALAQQAVTAWQEQLGPDDEMTLAACLHLGNALRARGEYGPARDVTLDTLDRMRHVLGPDHEYTLRAANSRSADLRLRGDFQDALLLDRDNLRRYQRVLTEDDPATLRSANNLAIDLHLLGSFAAAREIDEDTLRRRTILLGSQNPELLSSVNSVARDLYGSGDYAMALALQRESLTVHEQLVPNHASVIARRNVAILERKVGHYGPAVTLSRAVMEQAASLFGPLHEHALAATMTLGNALRAHHDLPEARQVTEANLERYREQFGAEHPFTLACASNYTIILRALGEAEQAADLDDATLASFRRTLGLDHPYVLCCACNVANNLASLGKHAEARKLSEDIAPRSERVRAPDHPFTLACLANLALDLEATGDAAEAAAVRASVHARLRRRLGATHPETVRIEQGKRAECEIEVPAT